MNESHLLSKSDLLNTNLSTHYYLLYEINGSKTTGGFLNKINTLLSQLNT